MGTSCGIAWAQDVGNGAVATPPSAMAAEDQRPEIRELMPQYRLVGKGQLTFSVPQPDLEKALTLTRAAAAQIDPCMTVAADSNIAKLLILGVGMRTHTGTARKMFGALARRGINISMINTSEVRVSVVVDGQRGAEALACLKEAFNVT